MSTNTQSKPSLSGKMYILFPTIQFLKWQNTVYVQMIQMENIELVLLTLAFFFRVGLLMLEEVKSHGPFPHKGYAVWPFFCLHCYLRVVVGEKHVFYKGLRNLGKRFGPLLG